MSKFKFEPKPPSGWFDTWQTCLEAALKKNGVKGCRALDGYWDNAIEAQGDKATYQCWVENNEAQLTQDAIDCLICNLQDMPKDDAILQLVNLYAEVVL